MTAELARRLGIEEIPIVKGAAAAFTHPDIKRTPAPHVAALADSLPPPAPGYAAVEIARHVLANPGEITVVAIGPLTNVAGALMLDPEVATAIKEIVIMGGIFLNPMPDWGIPGEFNVWVDPEAAAAVLRSGVPQRWVGLDVTLQVRLTRDHARQMQTATTPFAPFAGEATLGWIDHLEQQHPGDPSEADSCAMHDPLAVAVLTRPDLVEFKEAAVSVGTGDGDNPRRDGHRSPRLGRSATRQLPRRGLGRRRRLHRPLPGPSPRPVRFAACRRTPVAVGQLPGF